MVLYMYLPWKSRLEARLNIARFKNLLKGSENRFIIAMGCFAREASFCSVWNLRRDMAVRRLRSSQFQGRVDVSRASFLNLPVAFEHKKVAACFRSFTIKRDEVTRHADTPHESLQ